MRRKEIGVLLVIAAFYAVLQWAGVTCPILYVTGVSCAGCGMTRAWLSLLRLDLPAAFAYHPLFWLPVPVAAVALLRRRIPQKVFRLVIWCAAALFLAVYAVRLLTPEDAVVVFAPGQGLIGRLISRLLR